MQSQYRKKAVEKFGEDFFSRKNYFGAPFNITGRLKDGDIRTEVHHCNFA